MWISQGLMGLLVIIATTHGYKPDTFQGQAPKSIIPSDAIPIPMRESRSSIFWTGSRYNRRGSDGMKKMVKQRADRFYMGSRYGKRADPSQAEFDTDLCKFSSFHSLYPCARYR
uniref:RYamide-like peptide n=2 Tax=Lygus hesperus TaxID=30085 RepID=A0A146MGS5_LYGHE|nr:RYamide-like peptide precursor [Lygus hesperus]